MGLMDRVFGGKVVPLSQAETERLDYLRKLVADGLRGWVRAGEALRELRDKQLYRQSAATFEEFAAREFQLSGRRLEQLISAAETWKDIADKQPHVYLAGEPTERAVRELRALPPTERAEAYGEAMAAETATAGRPTPPRIKTVAETVARRRAASGRRVKHKPLRIKVPGAIVSIEWNGKGDGDAAAALRAALDQLVSKPSRAAA
jgi:hypothetical protein